MNRILVLGNAGSGKSTLAVSLGKILNLPVIHLDRYYWKAGWVESDKDEWRQTITRLISGDCWIMDGNYLSSLDSRIQRADVIIYLDFSISNCLWRIFKRRLRYRKSSRPDMAPGCSEKVDFEFIRWIWNFKKNVKPQVMKLIANYGIGEKTIILKKPCEVRRLLSRFSGLGKAPAG
jgi:adenylate kinase family enzyme